ncbi:MAG: cobaltochelatase subunit CobN, partial [Victivallales bacterium]|nr:cobaltochelatase subunit CobN [Victivallales bacterium]
MKAKYKRKAVFAGLILLTLSAYCIYRQWVSPTRIGFINYPDYMFAEFASAATSGFIAVERIDWKNNEKVTLGNYTAVYIFGMGLKLPPERLKALQEAINNGLAVYVTAATNDRNNITSLTGKQLDYVRKCLENQSRINFKRLLNYTRREIDGKKLFSTPIEEPLLIPHDGFFHIGEDALFKTLAEYRNYRRQRQLERPGHPKVCFLTSTAGPTAEHVCALVKAFEDAEINIYPIFGFRKRLEFIKAVNPDMIVLLPHGRLTVDGGNGVIDYLKKSNIPLLCPINVYEPYSRWLKDQRGMTGGIMSQSITMPELDGGILPFVLSAQFKDEKGLYVFKALPKRLRRFVSTAANYLELKRKTNKDKKLAIVYYKGPGKNALVASGLEVVPSLYNTLKKLQQAGYDTGVLPANAAELEKQIQANASVFNPYAKGSIEKFISNSSGITVPVTDYLSWAGDALPADLYAEVEQRYGKAPGPYMTVRKNETDNIVIPALRFGKIVLLPQPLPAYGSDGNKLIHGAKQAPPHPYIAAYLWARYGFGADVLIHFGTHGSLEFTPWKQTALSDYDWPDVLTGDMPHFYIYTINNIGEAVIAKRRSYAVLISHLTPPFMTSGLYDELSLLHDKIHACINAGSNKLLRSQYVKSILDLVNKNKIGRELGLKECKVLDDDTLKKIHNYIHELETAKINRGLYVLGRSYTASEAAETARLMAVDAIATGFADIDLVKGKLSLEQKSDAHYFDCHYLIPAGKIIARVFAGEKNESFFAPADLENLQAAASAASSGTTENLMAMMIGMQADANESGRPQAANRKKADACREELKALLLANCKIPENLEFIRSLKSEKTFERVSSLTNPRNLSKARRLAQLIPTMKKTVAIATQPQMLRLIRLLQEPELKSCLFELLKNKNVEAEILAEQNARLKAEVQTAISKEYVNSLLLCLQPQKLSEFTDCSQIRDMALLKKRIEKLELFRKRLTFLQGMQKHSDLIIQYGSDAGGRLAKILQSSPKS